MKRHLAIFSILLSLCCAGSVYAQGVPNFGGPMVPNGGSSSGGGVTPSGTFTAGNVIVGSGSTAVQDSANCTTYCALPNRFQVGSSTSATSLWPDTYIPGTSTASQLYSITSTPALAGFVAGAFNTRTSDTAATGGVTEGVQILTLNDKNSGSRNAWGLYIQAMYTATGGAGSQVLGSEYTITNNNTASSSLATSEDPFHVNNQGWAHAARFDCGDAGTLGGTTSNACQNAIDIINNGKAFTTGIVFGSTALDTSFTTNPAAISLPANTNGYAINWYSAAATPKWSLYSNGTDSNLKKISLGNTFIAFADESGTTDFQVAVTTGGQTLVGSSNGANCGNYIQIAGAANGSLPQVSAGGCSDANTTLRLAGKTNLGGVQVTGHLLSRNTTAAPTVSTCGTGTVAATSTDNAGQITATGATACTVVFNVTYNSAPFCTATDATSAVALKVTTATTGLVVSGLTSGDVFFYTCIGQAGG